MILLTSCCAVGETQYHYCCWHCFQLAHWSPWSSCASSQIFLTCDLWVELWLPQNNDGVKKALQSFPLPIWDMAACVCFSCLSTISCSSSMSSYIVMSSPSPLLLLMCYKNNHRLVVTDWTANTQTHRHAGTYIRMHTRTYTQTHQTCKHTRAYMCITATIIEQK